MDRFPKYTKFQVFCTTKAEFKDVDIGNLFIIQGGMLCIRMNYPHRRQYARNACIISAEDPGFCGLGLYIESNDEVDVIVENSITLRGAHLV